MKKKVDWQIDFNKFVEKNFDKPFAWGKWDCCLFSDACIKAITGESLIPKQLVWSDEKSAIQAITGYGKTLKNSISKAAKKKKLQKVDINYLQKGDLVVIDNNGQVCGIYDGSKTIGPNDMGIAAISGSKILEAWRINE